MFDLETERNAPAERNTLEILKLSSSSKMDSHSDSNMKHWVIDIRNKIKSEVGNSNNEKFKTDCTKESKPSSRIVFKEEKSNTSIIIHNDSNSRSCLEVKTRMVPQ